MKNDFKPVVGHRFSFRADWGTANCPILEVESNKTLSYTWGDDVLKSVVTWTLSPTRTGTLLRMEQTGSRPDQPRYYRGARGGWPRFFAKLEQVLARPPQISRNNTKPAPLTELHIRQTERKEGIAMKIKLTSVHVDNRNRAMRSTPTYWALPRRPISAMGPLAG